MFKWVLLSTLALLHSTAAFNLSPHRALVEKFDDNISLVPAFEEPQYEDESLESYESALSLDRKKAIAISFVQKQLKEYAIPGVLLSVVANNKTIISQGVGVKEFGNPKAPVTSSTLFQIGSYTKTFIAVGIAKLVDEKRVAWNDPVKKHLPTFQLIDKYAEQYTTIGDLLAMNTVFGDHEGDIPWAIGVFKSEKDLVKALSSFQTSRALRPGYAYSNLNYEILGQILEAVTNQTWSEYLRKVIWTPLGMNSTVGRVDDAVKPALSSGHYICDKKVIGPYSLVNSTMVAINPGNDYLSGGSILSSADDLSKFSHFLLSNGQGILSSEVFTDLVTGQTAISNYRLLKALPYLGYSIAPTGRAVSAGYGFDFVGDLIYNQSHYNKDGDTFGFSTRNGFMPSKNLGVVLAANGQSRGGRTSSNIVLDLIRTYLLGVFMDIPIPKLNNEFRAKVEALDKLPSQPCDGHYFSGQSWDIPGVVIPPEVKTSLVGTYTALVSPGYFGNLTLSTSTSNDLVMQYGAYSRRLIATKVPTTFIWDLELSTLTITVAVKDLNTTQPKLIVLDQLPFARA